MISIDDLDDQFSIEGELGFMETDGDLIAISICNKFADAEICLYGAHVTQFLPHGSFDVLWMSTDSYFEEGKPIRGGIPLCFPWFGPNATDANLPPHGFARLMYWEVIETASLETGETRVRLQLCSSEETKKIWPHDFRAELNVLVGNTLEVGLTITNTGSETIDYSAALHSYLNISGLENIKIEGLEGTMYHSGFGNELLTQNDQFLEINQEENRRYINTDSDCVLIDQAFSQAIRVSKKGSNVTVVWNPGAETAAKMDDMPDDGYETFVCIEAVNFYNDTIHLAPGEKYTTATTIGLDYGLKDMKLSGGGGSFNIV